MNPIRIKHSKIYQCHNDVEKQLWDSIERNVRLDIYHRINRPVRIITKKRSLINEIRKEALK